MRYCVSINHMLNTIAVNLILVNHDKSLVCFGLSMSDVENKAVLSSLVPLDVMLAARSVDEIPRRVRAKNALCGYYEFKTFPRLAPARDPETKTGAYEAGRHEVRNEGREREFGCNGYDRDANSRKLRWRSNPSAKNKKKRPDRERSARR